MIPWADYTRRNDPACLSGLRWFHQSLTKLPELPKVVCFWTKDPHRLVELYTNQIEALKQGDVLVLAQVTINYYPEMEPGVDYSSRLRGLRDLTRLLGGPEHVRGRIDPIICGYTTPAMLRDSVELAKDAGLNWIITNFLVPEYKGVGKLLMARGLIEEKDLKPAEFRKLVALNHLYQLTKQAGMTLAVCAETNWARRHIPDLERAACSDARWATSLRPELTGIFRTNPSRKNCGCCYSLDLGQYASCGGYVCPHQCLYCYAK